MVSLKKKIKTYGKKIIELIVLLKGLKGIIKNNMICSIENFEKENTESIDDILTDNELLEIENLRKQGYYSKI